MAQKLDVRLRDGLAFFELFNPLVQVGRHGTADIRTILFLLYAEN